jgi:hypothetical protein
LRALTPLTETEELAFRFHPTQEMAGTAGTASRRWPTYAAEKSAVKIEPGTTPTRFAGADLQLGAEARVKVTAQPEALQFAVSGDRAEVGKLDVRSTGGDAEIGWSPGETEAARQAVLKATAAKSTPADLASGARSPIRFADSKRVVIPGEPANPALAIEPDALDAAATDYLAAAADETGRFHASSIADSALQRQLEGYEWQRITAPPARAGYDVPAALERQFGRAPPPAEARAVALSGEYGMLEGHVTPDGELWIHRPQAEPALKAWHQLDVASNLTPSRLRSLVYSTDATFDIASRGVPRFAEAMAKGDTRGAVLAMDPELLNDPTVTGRTIAEGVSSANSARQLRASIGQASAGRNLAQAARNFMERPSDDLMHNLVKDLSAEHPAVTRAHVERLLQEPVSAPLDVVDDVARAAHDAGSPEIGDILEARAGQHSIAPDVISNMKVVETAQQRIGLRYRIPGAERKVVSGRDAIRARIERATHGDGSVTIYVDDRILLSREGVESAPTPRIAEWIDNAKVQWEERLSIGTYPEIIDDGQVQYRRVASDSVAPRHGGLILLVRLCGAASNAGSADPNAGSADPDAGSAAPQASGC